MRPSGEQLDQIRRISNFMFGDPEGAFSEHGRPETREEASDLLRLLDETPAQGREPMETRTCAVCGVDKPIDEFRKFGRGRKKECTDCDHVPTKDPVSERNRAKVAASVHGPAVQSDLLDPTLSKLRALCEFMGYDMEEAATVWLKVAELAGEQT